MPSPKASADEAGAGTGAGSIMNVGLEMGGPSSEHLLAVPARRLCGWGVRRAPWQSPHGGWDEFQFRVVDPSLSGASR